jgi:hypothetical protein
VTLLSLQDARDIIIIAAGSLAILILIALFVTTVVLGLAVRTLLGVIQGLLRDEATPLLHSGRETLGRVKGTATFVSETTAGPIIRAYGLVAGARRFIGVLSGVAGRRSRRS